MDKLNKQPILAGKVKHIAGGKQDGIGGVQTEEFLGNYDKVGNFIRKGSRKLDFVFEYVGKVIERLRGNTVDTEAPGGGPLTDREHTSRDGVLHLTNGEYMFTVEKFEKGTSRAAMKKIADAVCEGVASDFAEIIRKKEAALAPNHQMPAEYKGHAKKQEAEARRDERKKLISRKEPAK